jgi:hypothetical protein
MIKNENMLKFRSYCSKHPKHIREILLGGVFIAMRVIFTGGGGVGGKSEVLIQ